jgi:hypothetical protein
MQYDVPSLPIELLLVYAALDCLIGMLTQPASKDEIVCYIISIEYARTWRSPSISNLPMKQQSVVTQATCQSRTYWSISISRLYQCMQLGQDILKFVRGTVYCKSTPRRSIHQCVYHAHSSLLVHTCLGYHDYCCTSFCIGLLVDISHTTVVLLKYYR